MVLFVVDFLLFFKALSIKSHRTGKKNNNPDVPLGLSRYIQDHKKIQNKDP